MTQINSDEMRRKVINICKARPDAANDDLLLVALAWYMEGWDDPQLYEKLKAHSSAATLLRTRRKLVEEGIIKVDPAVRAARQSEIKKVKKALKGKS